MDARIGGIAKLAARPRREMAMAFITTDVFNISSNGVNLLDQESLFIVAGVTVAGGTGGAPSYDGAFTSGAGISAQIQGTLWGSLYGLETQGTNGENVVSVGSTGSVIGDVSAGIDLAGGENIITNHGDISTNFGSFAINIASAAPGHNSIFNTGTIGGGVYLTGGGNVITNTGVISSGNDVILLGEPAGSQDTINNSGTIAATAESVPAIGALNEAGSLVVNNSGHIFGSIQFTALLSGTSVYDGTLGSITGTIYSGSGENTLYGGAGAETFNLQDGTGTVDGGGGNDVVILGANFDSSDSIDGGAGNDTVQLFGDFSAGLTFTPEMMVNVERLQLVIPGSYALTMDDATVSAGQMLTVDATSLIAGNMLIFDGSAETDGKFTIDGTAGTYILTGGAGNDHFNFTTGFTATDQIDGGAGSDTLSLDGTFGTLTLGPSTIVNVEAIALAPHNGYWIVEDDANVAVGQTLTVKGGALLATDDLTFNGSVETDGRFVVTGGAATNTVYGGAGADVFNMSLGAHTFVSGGGGNDVIGMGAALKSTDSIDGGTGTDTLKLNGDYSAGITFSATTLVNVEKILLAAGHSYSLTTDDATVAAGQTLTVNGVALGATDSLAFDGSSESDGNFAIDSGAGNDLIHAGGLANTIGTGSGDDQIVMGAILTAADRIDGGAGNDEVDISGNYSAGLSFKSTTMKSVELLTLGAGNSYKLTMNDATVAAGQHLVIDGSSLGVTDQLTFNAVRELDGSYSVFGGAANDVIVGGQAGNILFGSLGQDKITGGSGADTFAYSSVAESTGAAHDILTGYDALTDQFNLPVTVTAIDAGVTTGTLSASHFDANLTVAIGSAQLAAGDAVLFTASGGNLAGHTFLVVDANGVAGYQAGADFVMELVNGAHLASLSATDFI
jgi:Ca2+-binding RTX toxin-like protein